MVSYRSYIDVIINQQRQSLALSSLSMEESYNTGWGGEGILVSSRNSELDLSSMLLHGLQFGLGPGVPVSATLALAGAYPHRTPVAPPASEDGNANGDSAGGESESTESTEVAVPLTAGTVVRIWPSMITSVEPLEASSTSGTMLKVTLVDPITYLSTRSIWGAYRAASAASMIGGALSLAAGGEGKPTLSPALPNLPTIKIIDNMLSPEAQVIPYSIASGQTLGEWLEYITGVLGIRIELSANPDDSIDVILTDQMPSGALLQMNAELAQPTGSRRGRRGGRRTPAPTPTVAAAHGRLFITGIEGNPGVTARDIVLDDPLHSTFQRVGGRGSVGQLIKGTNITLDEAAKRRQFEIDSAYTEMLVLHARSKQPGLRPGKLVQLDRPLLRIQQWQVFTSLHTVEATTYNNTTFLGRGDWPWRPPQPSTEGATYITGAVDGGAGFIDFEPVPRDRLGRIPVTLSFLPRPVGEEAKRLIAGDSNQDMRLDLSDFNAKDTDDYQNNQADWEQKSRQYDDGDFDDPFPGKPTRDLSEAEQEERTKMAEKRVSALKYKAYLEASKKDQKDKDRDGYVTKLDEEISTELAAKLREDPASHDNFRMQVSAKRAGRLGDIEGERIESQLLDEYERIFFPSSDASEDNPYADIRQEARLAKEQWPPRLPMAAIEPMAGGVHGFIPGHRQNDICRIIVHNPMYAEIMGFQYRSNRLINSSLVGATAGMVVEHDFRESWSGMVFRPTANLETPIRNSNTEGVA